MYEITSIWLNLKFFMRRYKFCECIYIYIYMM